jgi:glycine cleavage system H protein
MPEYLETTVDKFTFKVARDRMYTQDGVWILPIESPEGVKVRVGLTDYVQQYSGDIAFANLKPIGTVLSVGDEFAEVETIKVNVSLPSPVAGAIVEVNKALEMCPELVNQDPYDKGWLVLMKPTDWDAAGAGLLDPNAYFDLMQSQVDEELKETS